jgi:glutathione peroxidase
MTARSFLALFLALFLLCSLPASAEKRAAKEHPDASQTSNPKEKETAFDFSLVDQDGKVVSLSDYKGKVLLIVNLASQSIYSSQIAALNDLQKTYGPKGLEVIGIPSSDFGGEELKDAVSMRKYYTDTVHADFPVFASAKLTGINAIPLYQFLCDPKLSVPGGDIRWNYTKFLIDRSGTPLARYEVDVDPADVDFHVAIESALSGKFKKPSASGEKKKPAGDEESSDDDDDQ